MAINYYQYSPSLAAAIIFILCFSVSSLLHIFQILKSKTWFFIPLLVGSVFETVGFIGRAIGAQETPDWTFGPYVMQNLLLLLGPTCYAASIYIILGRLIRLLNAERNSLIRSTWLTRIFLFGDVLSIALQGIGGGKLVNAETPDDRSTGESIIIGGLVVQMLFFSLFIAIACNFHLRVKRDPKAMASDIEVRWERLMVVLYITSILILIRSLFRLIEYSMGHDSELQSNEVYIYILDAVPMLAVSALFNVVHPSHVLAPKQQTANTTDSEMQFMNNYAGYRAGP